MGLDRKTKDVDASIELLEDRRDQYKILEMLTGVVVVMTLTLAVLAVIASLFITNESVNENMDDIVRILIGFVLLSALLVFEWAGHLYYTQRQHDLSLLIYLKRHERKR